MKAARIDEPRARRRGRRQEQERAAMQQGPTLDAPDPAPIIRVPIWKPHTIEPRQPPRTNPDFHFIERPEMKVFRKLIRG